MKAQIRSLSISVPAFNEEAALGDVLGEARRTLDELGVDGEILVIDDGSRDGTYEIARRWAAEDNRVRVVRHDRNMGFGTTLREVFQLPNKDWVFFAPADGQIPIDEVRHLLGHTHESDYILGWRTHRADPLFRRIQAGLYNVLISLVLGRRIHDVDSVALARRELLQSITLKAQSVFVHAELALEAERRGARLLEIPIAHRPRQGGQSQGAKLSTILRTVQDLVGYVFCRGPAWYNRS